jgi:hypothetical protein
LNSVIKVQRFRLEGAIVPEVSLICEGCNQILTENISDLDQAVRTASTHEETDHMENPNDLPALSA